MPIHHPPLSYNQGLTAARSRKKGRREKRALSPLSLSRPSRSPASRIYKSINGPRSASDLGPAPVPGSLLAWRWRVAGESMGSLGASESAPDSPDRQPPEGRRLHGPCRGSRRERSVCYAAGVYSIYRIQHNEIQIHIYTEQVDNIHQQRSHSTTHMHGMHMCHAWHAHVRMRMRKHAEDTTLTHTSTQPY